MRDTKLSKAGSRHLSRIPLLISPRTRLRGLEHVPLIHTHPSVQRAPSVLVEMFFICTAQQVENRLRANYKSSAMEWGVEKSRQQLAAKAK